MKTLLVVIIIVLATLYICISLKNRFCEYPVRHPRANSKIYVSYTTIPERIDKLKLSLDSIKNQTLKPYKIYIHIASKTLKGVSYDMDSLNKLVNSYDNVVLNVIEKDLGPVTKLLPMVKIANNDDYIILVDDDVVYDKNLIKTLYNSELDAVGLTGRLNMLFIYLPPCVMKVDFLETFNGAFYRAGLFQGFEEYNNKLNDECIFQDDIKIGKFLNDKNINRYVIPYLLLNIHDGKGTPQLMNDNVGNENEKCFKNIWNKKF